MVSSLGLSCPQGGSFYVCEGYETEFLGCCSEDPCNDTFNGLCPSDDVRNSTFSSDAYDSIAAQACYASNSSWYTCTGTNPPFMGCCTVNACANEGCPAVDMTAAVLSSDETKRDTILGPWHEAMGSSSSSAGSSATSSSTSKSTGKTTSSSGSTSTSTTSPGTSQKGKVSTGTLVGGIVGGVVGGLILAGLIAFFWYKRRQTNKRNGPTGDTTVTSPTTAEYAGIGTTPTTTTPSMAGKSTPGHRSTSDSSDFAKLNPNFPGGGYPQQSPPMGYPQGHGQHFDYSGQSTYSGGMSQYGGSFGGQSGPSATGYNPNFGPGHPQYPGHGHPVPSVVPPQELPSDQDFNIASPATVVHP